eukprot:scaffold240095_cov33-Tisochrysis_lutea.AAC.2
MLSLVMLASSAALSEAEIDMGESIQGVLAMVDQLERQMAQPPALQNPCDKVRAASPGPPRLLACALARPLPCHLTPLLVTSHSGRRHFRAHLRSLSSPSPSMGAFSPVATNIWPPPHDTGFGAIQVPECSMPLRSLG